MALETPLLFAPLPGRSVLAIHGADARGMLQGIISNDVEKIEENTAIWAALLTPQGKYLHDFFICQAPDGALWLDCEAGRRDDLMSRLKRFKLRADVTLLPADNLAVVALFGGPVAALGLPDTAGAARPLEDGCLFVDPRLAAAGARAILPADNIPAFTAQAGASMADAADYDRHRLSLGLPDGSRDMEVEKTVLLEAGFDELNGVDWTKGCYMGQEVTARTYHRGLVKRRLVPVQSDGSFLSPETPLTDGEREIGEIRSAAGDMALALVRLDALSDGAVFDAGAAKVFPRKPAWANF